MNYAKATHKYTLEIDGQQFYVVATTDGDIGEYARFEYLSRQLNKKMKQVGAHEISNN